MPKDGRPGALRLLLPALPALLLVVLLLTAAQAVAAPAVPREPRFLRLQGGTFDPLQPPPVPARLSAAAPDTGYALVQFAGPVQARWREGLEAAGAQIVDYLPDYTYVVRLPDGSRVSRAALARLPGVRWTGDLSPAYRLDPALWAAAGPLTLTLQFYPGADPSAALRLPGVQVLEQARSAWQTTLFLRTDAGLLPELAALPGVRWIEPVRAPVAVNDVAAGLTGVVTAWTTLGLSGSGQVVAVADTGLDLGAGGPITDFAGRVVAAHCVGRSAPCLWDDPHGHGTHVAGSVLGSGALSGGQLRGMAPAAGLVVQSLYSPTQSGGLYVPADLNLLFAPAYTDGARIHNNSWGVPGNRYDTRAQAADQFVWDHPDALIVAAAGNGGIDRGADGLVDPGSLYSPATAKNVLAVGASESLRLGQGYTGDYGHSPGGANFPVDPVHSDGISDVPWGLAAFSSRGPASDGRVRPDLVAPGTNIVSARSHHPGAVYPQIYGADYAFYSGSSQAAPLVSGAAALLREWYTAQGMAQPSAALLRATLIHGAQDLAPGQYGPAQDGTLLVADDVESSSVWTSTTWTVTSTYGYHSAGSAWVARGTAPGYRRLDATLNLSGTAAPLLTFWNRRTLNGSTVRVYACGSQRALFSPSSGGRVGWAQEAVDVSNCAGSAIALLRFEFQCTSNCTAASPDVWALDDLAVADGARLAEVGPAPGVGQGWGRLDLAASLLPGPGARRWYADVSPGLQTSQTLAYTLVVSDARVPLRASLAWSDYPATPSAALVLVNDLDLTLEGPGGGLLYPNGLTGPDRLNNVEQIVVASPVTGTYRLRVRGHNVPFGPQPYALVVTLGGRVWSWQVYLPLAVREN